MTLKIASELNMGKLTGGSDFTLNRSIQTNLSSTTSATDTGGNITPGVTGTLGVANGGTGKSSFTANSVLMSGTSSTAALTQRTLSDSSSSSALSTSSTNIPTERDIAYGLCTVNGSSQTRSMNMVVATSYGTSGQVLTSNGSSSTPTFKALPTTPYYKQTASVGATAYRSGNVITINGAYNLQTTDAWETVMTLNDSFPAPTEEISFCAIGSGNSSINSVLAEGRINTDKTVQLLSNNNSGLVRFNATYIVNG